MMYADLLKRTYLDGMILSHCDNYVIFGFSLHIRHDTTFYGFPVHGERLYTLFHVVGILDFDAVGALAELTG